MKPQRLFYFTFFFLIWSFAKAQQTPSNLRSLQDSLNRISNRVLSAQSDEQKFAENGLFVKTLVEALKTQNSFESNLDSLKI